MAEESRRRNKRGRRARRTIRGVQSGATNALALLRQGRLSAPYKAPFDVVREDTHYRLRHYAAEHPGVEARVQTPIVLVPPLMVTSEIYDISPELSAVGWLRERGCDVWLVDFGAPEDFEGGLDRTLDDHILAIDSCIDEVVERTGSDVHLAGYSQGGMFCYQTAAYRQSRNIRSVITFGSPVDVRKIIPVPINDDLATRLLHGVRDVVQKPLNQLEGLPGFVTSTGFKLLSVGKEAQQFIDFLGKLPNRKALEAREPRRRFLGGDGFVAWPAPALRRMIDEVVVKNLLANGGLVINKRPITLADIDVPVLYFVGLTDIIARPESVRAIADAAPLADLYEIDISAGHFGLVVGSKAIGQTWPMVLQWCEWHEGTVEKPPFLDDVSEAVPAVVDEKEAGGAYDFASELLDNVWNRLGDVSLDVSNVLENVRWQIPRLTRMKRLKDSSRVNPGRVLAEQASAIPESDFFLWGERAFTYLEADQRVNQTIHAFRRCGVEPGQHVGVFLNNHPDYLTACVALNRMGCVAVLFNAGLSGDSLSHALETAPTDALIVDREHSYAADVYDGSVIRIGREPGEPSESIQDLRDVWDASEVEPPADILINSGRGGDTAFLIFTSGTTGLPKAARITNRRWAMAGLSAAAAAQLTNRDTVYCSLPLYHATGLLIGCGGALVGGARLALAPKFSTRTFWNDIHRYGASVVIYVGELCRYLVNAPPSPMENSHSVRLFTGNGMRADVWRRVLDRFGRIRVIEFYGSTEGNVGLVNLTGEKIGSVGRPFTEEADVELARYDVDRNEVIRGEAGYAQRAEPNEPGMLVSRVLDAHPISRFDGYADADATESKLLRDLFESGDVWFNTGDVMTRDADGDFYFVDRVGDTFRWRGENVSTEQVARVLISASQIDLCSVYGVELEGHEGRAGMAAVQLKQGYAFDGRELGRVVEQNLFPAARPLFVRVVEELPVTTTLKLIKYELQSEGANPRTVDDALYYYDVERQSYEPLSPADYDRIVEDLMEAVAPASEKNQQPSN